MERGFCPFVRCVLFTVILKYELISLHAKICQLTEEET